MLKFLTANPDGSFNFQRNNIMQNGIVLHPLQNVGMASLPWFYTSKVSPGNTASYIQPNNNIPTNPFDF
jgi:hypothetical protein